MDPSPVKTSDESPALPDTLIKTLSHVLISDPETEIIKLCSFKN